MKKKSKTSTLTRDLKSLIKDHSIFFDKLIEQIPARFYLPVEDKKPWFQGLSKVAKASAKKESRENIKKARRARLDPEEPSGTLDLLKKNIEEENEEDEDEDDEEEDFKHQKSILTESKEESLTYEELRQRYHQKLEELKSGRKAGPSEESNRSKKRQINQGKRKRYEEISKKQDSSSTTTTNSKESKSNERDVDRVAEELTFGHVKIDDKDDQGRKRRKLSKIQTLEEAKKLQELKKDPEKGEIIEKKHQWSAASSRAAGFKVHDDPKLIKKSIKKEKKKHQKNVGKWKERVESRDKIRADKQKTRSENIAGRIHQNKMKKIEKREKKLMRPGFEGRKEGFINESST